MGQEANEVGEPLPVQWIVESASSQSELHPGSEWRFDKPWLTQKPTDDAWLVLAPRPPTAFNRVGVGNAGSALLEIHGVREDAQGDADSDYEVLLSAQQLMSVKDLMSKSNRNQAFNYDIDGTNKLAPLAAQQRWRKIRVSCRQPFGTSEHRACIGLEYISFTPCHCESKSNNNSIQFPNCKNSKPLTNPKRKLPSWLSSSEPNADNEGLPEKKPRASPHRDVDLKAVNSDVEEGGIDTHGQGGRLKPEHAESQALKGKAVALKRRSPDAKETGGKETKKAKFEKESSTRVGPVVPADQSKDAFSKAPVESNRAHAQFPAEDNKQPHQSKLSVRSSESAENQHDRDQIETNGYDFPQGDKSVTGESSQRKLHVSKEGKGGRASREDNGLPKDGPEREFSKLLEGVVFTISGIQNPERGQLRTKGLEMGAQYRPDWSPDCTLLVCAFTDTPKFKQVQANGGSIVSKDWILECYKNHKLVDFERFVLNKGRPWRLPDTAEIELKRKKVNCGSVEEIRKWAQEDLTLIIDWLLQQDAKPEPEELEFTAAQGILVCLEDAVKSLTENQGLSKIIENWGFLPRAVKELAAIEEGEKGYTTTSISTLREAERLKGIYDEVLNVFLASSRKSTNVTIDQKKGKNEEDEDDDDATEVMSDVDSQETVDYDSDDTIVLDSEAIVECTQKLMERFARNK